MNTRTGNATLADFQAAGSLRKRSDDRSNDRSDELLVEKGKFDELIQTHQPGVTRLVTRLLAWPADQAHIDDVVQEVFLSAWQHRERYRGESEVSTWLGRIAINKARNYVRSRVNIGRLMNTLKSVFAEPMEPGGAVEQFDELHDAIARLRPRDREIIVLRYLEEHTVDELAALLQIKRNTVDVRLKRARKRLEQILKPQTQSNND